MLNEMRKILQLRLSNLRGFNRGCQNPKSFVEVLSVTDIQLTSVARCQIVTIIGHLPPLLTYTAYDYYISHSFATH
jgi:hypothetical protein